MADPPSPDGETFETVDWEALDGGGPRASRRTRWFLAALAVLAVAFLYDLLVLPGGEPLVAGWDVSGLDWLFMASLLAFGAFVVVPLYRTPRLTRGYWRSLRDDPAALLGLAYLAVLFVVGVFGPVVYGTPATAPRWVEPPPRGTPPSQPPLGFPVSVHAVGVCAGRVVDGACHGTLAHPLGTSLGGDDVLAYVFAGAGVAVKIAFAAGAIIAPLATAVGVAAAQFGGRVDEALMRYVDLQQAIPAFFAVIIAQVIVGGSILLVVAVFGLLNWGGMARLVRSEALQRGEEAYVLAARGAGSSSIEIARRHLVPNVSNTVVTAMTVQLPVLVILEATLSFLRIGSLTTPSWGFVITTSVNDRLFPTANWWGVVFPALALLLTVVAFNVVGDALRDALDPRTGGEG